MADSKIPWAQGKTDNQIGVPAPAKPDMPTPEADYPTSENPEGPQPTPFTIKQSVGPK